MRKIPLLLAFAISGCGTVRGQVPDGPEPAPWPSEPPAATPKGPPAPLNPAGQPAGPNTPAPQKPPASPATPNQPPARPNGPSPTRTGNTDGPSPTRTGNTDGPSPTRTGNTDGPAPTRTSNPDGPAPTRTSNPDGPARPAEPPPIRYEPIVPSDARPLSPTPEPPARIPAPDPYRPHHPNPAHQPGHTSDPTHPNPAHQPGHTSDPTHPNPAHQPGYAHTPPTSPDLQPAQPTLAAPTRDIAADALTDHLAAYRLRDAFAFAAALAPDTPPSDTLWPLAAKLATDPTWLMGFPLDAPEAAPLLPRLAQRAVQSPEPCDSAACDRKLAVARRYLPFIDPTRRAELEAALATHEAYLAPWRTPRPGVIGVLLPLSGPFEAFGRTAREALDLAATAFPGVTLVYRDTAATPETALAEAERLIFEDRVSALIGPVGRGESQPVTSFTRRWAIAHLPLGTSVEAPDASAALDSVLRLRTSPNELAESLARYARLELGRLRVAILASTDASMTEQAAAFAAEWTRQGGEVVRTVPFDPAAKSFDGPLGTLVQSTRPKRAKVDFDAVFVAAPGAVARRLVSHFAYWGIPLKLKPDQRRASKKAPEPVQLLGSGGWLTPQLIDRAEGVTSNAIFADTWAPDPSDPESLAFIELFERTHNKRPTAFHAEVFDTLRVAVAADLEARMPVFDPAAETSPRARLAQALLRDRITPLVVGPLVVSGGKAQPRAHLLTVHQDQIRSRLTEEEERLRFSPPDPTPPEQPGGLRLQ